MNSPDAPAGRAFLAPGILLLLVALGGRYTLDRAGLESLAWVDLRVVGLTLALAVLAFELSRRAHPEPIVADTARPEGWLVFATLFFLYQIASGLWAPEYARVNDKALDVALMAVLTLALYVYARPDPATVIRWTFVFCFFAALVFGLGALLVSEPDVQGRYAAFGGGPNVFVRIEILGIIAVLALYRLTGRALPLLTIPFFLVTAVLSGSRAGLLAAGLVAVAALLKVRGRPPLAPTLGVLVTVSAVAGFLWFSAPPALVSVVTDRFVQQTAEDQYLSGRTEIWTATVRLAAEYPVTGAGLDGFYGEIGRQQQVEYPHQYVLAVAAEGGLIGLVLLAGSVLLWLLALRRGRGHPVEAILAVTAAAFIWLSSMFSGDYYDARFAWLFMALAAAAATTPPARDEEVEDAGWPEHQPWLAEPAAR